nr:DUF2079 domain-containing protein [Streptomyces novaecaesareae]
MAFAVPLLAFSLTALGDGRPRAAAYWALPLLLVKEDLGLTVAVIGLLIARRGHRRLGSARPRPVWPDRCWPSWWSCRPSTRPGTSPTGRT